MVKLIDDKGYIHIFNLKINIIDFLVLVFILCLMPMFYFGYKIMMKPIPASPPTITLDKAEYEQMQAEQKARYESGEIKLIRQRDDALKERNRLRSQRDNLLKEHKRLRKYFE